MISRRSGKKKSKGKGIVVFAGFSVLIILVFAAGWLTVRMMNLSNGLDLAADNGKSETVPPNETAENAPKVIKKKIPSPPAPPPVSVKETVVIAQATSPVTTDATQQETSGRMDKQPVQAPEKVSISEQHTSAGAEKPAAAPKTDPLPPPKTDTAPTDAPSEKTPSLNKRYAIQVGAFRVEAFAEKRIAVLKSMEFDPFVFSTTDSKGHTWYTVRVGRYETIEKSEDALSTFKDQTGFPAAVVHADSLAAASKKK